MKESDLRKKRFWEKVRVCGENQCWPWLAAQHTQGYGAFAFTKYKVTTAHRVAWAITYNRSRLPSSKMQVMHSCDNKLCVNPKHLSLGTASENEKQAFERVRKVPTRPILKKYCKRGHRRTHKNTIMKRGSKDKKAYPVCKTCVQINNSLSRERNKSPEKTRYNTIYMRKYRAAKRYQSPRSGLN